MGFLDSLKSIFSGSPQQGGGVQWIYTHCRRCGEVIKTRVDLRNDLSLQDEGGYISRKTLVGNQLCFQRIEVTLRFDEHRSLIEQQAQGGEFITAEEFLAATSES